MSNDALICASGPPSAASSTLRPRTVLTRIVVRQLHRPTRFFRPRKIYTLGLSTRIPAVGLSTRSRHRQNVRLTKSVRGGGCVVRGEIGLRFGLAGIFFVIGSSGSDTGIRHARSRAGRGGRDEGWLAAAFPSERQGCEDE